MIVWTLFIILLQYAHHVNYLQIVNHIRLITKYYIHLIYNMCIFNHFILELQSDSVHVEHNPVYEPIETIMHRLSECLQMGYNRNYRRYTTLVHAFYNTLYYTILPHCNV